MTVDEGPLKSTTGTTNNTDIETGKFLNNSRKSGTFSHILLANKQQKLYEIAKSQKSQTERLYKSPEHVLSQVSGFRLDPSLLLLALRTKKPEDSSNGMFVSRGRGTPGWGVLWEFLGGDVPLGPWNP